MHIFPSFARLLCNHVTWLLHVIFFRSRWASPPSWCNLVFFIIGWLFYNSKSSIPNGSASLFGRITFGPSSFAMAPKSRTTRWSSCVNFSVNSIEQDELAGSRSDASSNEAPTPPKAPTPPLVSLPSEDLFTKFMTVFMETTQSQAQALAELWERLLKARTPEIYWDKSHMECYHFCQQCKDHFETSSATGANRTPFVASFFSGSISLRWAQHKRRHKSTIPITWSEFKAFLRKDLGSSQAFIDSICSKFRKDSQYQLEEARDWASQLQHL